MGIWKKIFGKKPDKSPYLPTPEEPLDISFAKNFTSNGGLFLYNQSKEKVLYNFHEICKENKWTSEEIICLNQKLSSYFKIPFIVNNSGKLTHYKSLLINCEYLISNTGKILLSSKQINHFKLSDLPKTILVVAKLSQLVKDVSQGMTQIKNKYPNKIPTNITTLKTIKDKKASSIKTNSKNIYLLLEDI